MMSPSDARDHIAMRLDFARRHLAKAKSLPASDRTGRFNRLMSAVQAAEDAQGAANVAGARVHKSDLRVRMMRAEAQEISEEGRVMLSQICFPNRRKPTPPKKADPERLNAARRAIDRFTRSL